MFKFSKVQQVHYAGDVGNCATFRWHIYSVIKYRPTDYYVSRTATFKIIVAGWVAYFFATQCMYIMASLYQLHVFPTASVSL